MAQGSEIVVEANPKGKFDEGIIGDTSKPGTIMQIQAGTAMSNGRFTWIAAATGTDGKKALRAVLLPNSLEGQLATAAYVANKRCFLYFPLPGEECNCIVGETAGTGNTYAIGDRLILEGTTPAGTLFAETGSPQDTMAVCLEAFTQQASARLTWVKFM